jgi:predicted DCC family thiol-disulfide oxidoreductase YuxK
VSESQQNIPIVFYDGDCGFCNSSVQFILKKRKEDIHFATLQSSFAEDLLKKHDITIEMDTLYLLRNDKIYSRSNAALRICKSLKGGYPLMMGFWIIPKFIRDGVYNMIAKRRHKIRAGHCVIPTENERKLFLDSTS